MRELLIATSNDYKRKQFQFLLRNFPITVKTLADIEPHPPKVDENGRTAYENACIKAHFWAERTGLPTLADDAGVEIDALGGLPGLQVRRWNGLFPDTVSDEEWLEYFLKQIKDLPADKREAKIVASWVIVTPDQKEFTKDIVLPFSLITDPVRPYPAGSPLSAVRWSDRYQKTEAELTDEEKWSELEQHLLLWTDFLSLIQQ